MEKKKGKNGVREETGRVKKREKTQRAYRIKTGGIFAALLAAVAVYIVMVQSEKKVLMQYEKGTIYTAVQTIPKGMLLTSENLDLYLCGQELDKSCIPETALTSRQQVEELVASYDIDCGTLLTMGMFQELNLILAKMEEPVIAGFKADDIFQVADGILREGDKIDIYAVREEETIPVWQGVVVQQVFDASGNSIPAGDKTTAAQRVNVYLERGEVSAFYRELASGALRVVKICGDAE